MEITRATGKAIGLVLGCAVTLASPTGCSPDRQRVVVLPPTTITTVEQTVPVGPQQCGFVTFAPNSGLWGVQDCGRWGDMFCGPRRCVSVEGIERPELRHRRVQLPDARGRSDDREVLLAVPMRQQFRCKRDVPIQPRIVHTPWSRLTPDGCRRSRDRHVQDDAPHARTPGLAEGLPAEPRLGQWASPSAS